MIALAEAQVRTKDAMTRLEDTKTRLGNIVIGHEQRLQGLEGQ
jgi:hypothetical protein